MIGFSIIQNGVLEISSGSLKLITFIKSGLACIKVSDLTFDSKLERTGTVDWNFDISLTISTLSKLMILKSLIILSVDIDSCDANDLFLSILSDKMQQNAALNIFDKYDTLGLVYC